MSIGPDEAADEAELELPFPVHEVEAGGERVGLKVRTVALANELAVRVAVLLPGKLRRLEELAQAGRFRAKRRTKKTGLAWRPPRVEMRLHSSSRSWRRRG